MKDMDQYIVGAMLGASGSIWAVSAFSLELDDYEAILANAYNLMSSISAHVDEFMSYVGEVGEIASIEDIEGVAKYVSDKVPSTMEVKLQGGKSHLTYKIDWQGEGSLSAGHDFNLAQGFKDGITMYFKNASSN